MRPIRIGEHRQRVTIQNPMTPETSDTFAQPTGTYTTIGTFWAFVKPLQGHELVAAKQVKAQATISIRIRWQGSSIPITPLSRIIFNGRTFGLFDVKNIEERNRSYEMVAYEIQQGTSI
jgi:SPP1 family predicted phage head-tail adaptor